MVSTIPTTCSGYIYNSILCYQNCSHYLLLGDGNRSPSLPIDVVLGQHPIRPKFLVVPVPPLVLLDGLLPSQVYRVDVRLGPSLGLGRGDHALQLPLDTLALEEGCPGIISQSLACWLVFRYGFSPEGAEDDLLAESLRISAQLWDSQM